VSFWKGLGVIGEWLGHCSFNSFAVRVLGIVSRPVNGSVGARIRWLPPLTPVASGNIKKKNFHQANVIESG
jgi:hypothetical protein